MKHISFREIQNDMEVTAKILITVRCAPFKYLKDSKLQSFSKPGTITNPGTYDARPLLKLYAKGSGASSITINGTKFTMNMQKEFVFVDCELMDSYYTITNTNRFMSGEFPVLHPGKNKVAFNGAIAKIHIEPRWRNL